MTERNYSVQAKITYRDKRSSVVYRRVKGFDDISSARSWLQNFEVEHIEIINKRIIGGIELIEKRLKHARRKARRDYDR